MPGPCSAPLGFRDEKGPAPRSGKTDVAKRGATRKAVTDELARMAAARKHTPHTETEQENVA
jgi:hypothetical protein